MASTPPNPSTIFRLPRLPVGWKDQPQLFERYWDEAMGQIEKTLRSILVLPEIQEAIARAEAAAQTAQDAADTATMAASSAAGQAQAAADQAQTAALEASLVNSYPQVASGPLITASSAGVISIANHTRVYGDSTLNPSVSVTGGTIDTGAVAGNIVRIYYSDPARAGGTVTYSFTIDPETSPAQGANIHSVGAAQIPDTGSIPGRNVNKPGYIDYNQNIE